jgi:DNA-binding MarR family transcriptional regulator
VTRYNEVVDELTLAAYRSLAEFRHQLRSFLHYSEEAARARGIEPQQHQLLLALKGLPEATPPTIAALAERLQLRHHSAVELIDRLERSGRVKRHTAQEDRREVRLKLTAKGERVLRALTMEHRAELTVTGPKLMRALRAAIRPANGRKKK